MKAWLKLFFSGWLANTAWQSLFQDALGQEKYIRMVETCWISAWATVPLALLLLWFAWMMGREGRREVSSTPFSGEDTPARSALVKIVGKLSDENLAPLGREIRDTALDGLR